MTKVSERTTPKREILVVGPYGVLGTGVLDAAAVVSSWRVTTAARRPAHLSSEHRISSHWCRPHGS
jgi:hypothetical protein